MATTASTVSNVPTVRAGAGALAAAATGAFAGAAGAPGRDTAVPGRPPAALGGAGGGGAEPAGRGAAAVGAAAATGAAGRGAAVGAAAAGAALVGGKEGSLIVGAAVGLGGRAMRTVSFFGCTLAASGGFGGTPPGVGGIGVGSAINYCADKLGGGKIAVKSLLPGAVSFAAKPALFQPVALLEGRRRQQVEEAG